MKILVAVKQAPRRDCPLTPNVDSTWVEDGDLEFDMNEPDAYALEAALRLREKHGGEVVAISVGPDRVTSTIREALAKGADRGIHVACDAVEKLDSLAVARLLADAAKSESPDLILTGLQSEDLGAGQTGVILAELLGMPHSTIVMAVEVDGASVRVKRELEDGWFQFVRMPMPALLTIQSGIDKLRYANLMGIKKAKTKEIRAVAAAMPESQTSLSNVAAPSSERKARIWDGDAGQAAAELVQALRSEVHVL